MVAARTGKEIRVGSDLHLVSWFRSSRDQISRSPGESRDPPQPWTPAFAGNAGKKGRASDPMNFSIRTPAEKTLVEPRIRSSEKTIRRISLAGAGRSGLWLPCEEDA